MQLRLGSARAPRVIAGAPPANSRCDAAHQTVRSTSTPRRGAGDATREGAGATRAAPLLTTTQLMYPGGFVLRAALDGWIAGETPEQIRQRAAAAYARNQKISAKSAAGVFATGRPPPRGE